ncbi:MAG TPA: hypothetical protein PLR32_07050 [candidate division Zixibacteria bacterium]|nr:hypothetical protein [candidate division Zixibacteria bacterium]HPM35946.1 hypothetical protein [candidate division Zixibacteria bacterium]
MKERRHRLNCWEFKNCGREPGGLMAGLLGQCPVAAAMKYDGVNGGLRGGRICWLVDRQEGCAGGGRCGTGRCHECDFYRRVVFEEDDAATYAFRTAPT